MQVIDYKCLLKLKKLKLPHQIKSHDLMWRQQKHVYMRSVHSVCLYVSVRHYTCLCRWRQNNSNNIMLWLPVAIGPSGFLLIIIMVQIQM